MSRNDDLPVGTRAPKQIHHSEKVNPIEALQGIVQDDCLKRRHRERQVERKKDLDGQRICLGSRQHKSGSLPSGISNFIEDGQFQAATTVLKPWSHCYSAKSRMRIDR